MSKPSLKDLLRAENTRALMIDYSADFLIPETRSAFVHGGRLAQQFSKAGIPVDWCVYPKWTKSLEPDPLAAKVADIKLEGADQLVIVEPKPGDLLFVKHTISLLQEGNYKPMIEDLDTPTIIVGGVLATACVKYTLRDLIDLGNNANIIIAHDAINLEYHTPDEYKQSVLNASKKFGKPDDETLFTASNDELIAALA